MIVLKSKSVSSEYILLHISGKTYSAHFEAYNSVADPGENLIGALHSNFGSCGCGGRG